MTSRPGKDMQQFRMNALERTHFVIATVGVFAPLGTFVIAVSDVGHEQKLAALTVIAAFSLAMCISSYINLKRAHLERPGSRRDARSDHHGTGDAPPLFCGSRDISETMRHAMERLAETLPHSAAALFLPEELSGMLRAVHSVGRHGTLPYGADQITDSELAMLAFHSREAEIDEYVSIESNSQMPAASKVWRSAAAVPLLDDGRVFAIFQIYSDLPIERSDANFERLRRAAEYLTPLLLGSIALENRLADAITDQATGIPNERALTMVLEYQLAECERRRGERPLTLLCVDIRDFAKINENFGRAIGDRILRFTAEGIRAQLRKMDFLARAAGDEFLVVLPTASESTALDIIERIKSAFVNNPFLLEEGEQLKIWLNFGHATFWNDGETAPQLIRSARVRRQQEKIEDLADALSERGYYVN